MDRKNNGKQKNQRFKMTIDLQTLCMHSLLLFRINGRLNGQWVFQACRRSIWRERNGPSRERGLRSCRVP
uniref:Uncharacterized protein n=1 Tax=Lotus japonicus TaxID=34305 RepID=I3SZH9_LOTJA|nr:unknown [Lotus japonicus]